ncbi:sensor histidine kinase [Actinoplanes sp. NPDC026670]|uniref:sensor histidine kinase n=1 Tax=Actinoplanes sp. NPDC026670 TaxID=3154700 RepID=UPI00340AD867
MSESQSSYWLWELFFGVTVVAVGAAVVIVDGFEPWRRAVALAAIGAMLLLHLLVGRPLIAREAENTAALLTLLTQLVLFGVAVWAVPLSTWLMFAVIPVIFQMVTVRLAIALVVVANLIPVGVEAWYDPADIGMEIVIAAISTGAGICIGLWILKTLEESEQRATLITDLEASRAEVARLSHEAGVAAERTRLAGEIHDTLAQGFTSIITLVQAADPALRDERLALAVRTARENLAESRALVAALSPTALASASLPEAVRRSAARFSEEAGVAASVRITGDVYDLPTRTEVVLLRAAQEALTNVRRHAQAHEAAVLLAYSPAVVRLVIRDDGCGIKSDISEGFGLSGMRARAGQVDGTLTIRSDADTGTTVELEIPT